uniref:Uncharacterized protein asm32 n=1 Tax=Actinosynnema pretiosum subsp. auranticum TaxID=42198 RepID=Q8KUI2_ACTPA|nr:unknown [Actinosynnema pretiosum subsp. auranticum]
MWITEQNARIPARRSSGRSNARRCAVRWPRPQPRSATRAPGPRSSANADSRARSRGRDPRTSLNRSA